MENTHLFKPCPLLAGRHRQTVLGIFFNFYKAPSSKTQIITLPDGDKLSLEIATPKGWKESDPTVFMIHGLCGSHNSPYLIRMSNKLYKMGVRSVRINLRGCGSSRGMARRMYHSGSSQDVAFALRQMKEKSPLSPFHLMGFSMGGNIVLKLTGELGQKGEHLVDHVIAVSPPVNLETSSRLLSLGVNRMYELYFVRLLRIEAEFRQKLFPDLPRVKLHDRMKMIEFDEAFTAPHIGHRSAIEYYQASSSKPYIPSIRVPCEILYSLDDPIIDAHALNGVDLPEHVRVFKTPGGGHMGFLGSPIKGGKFRWMDHVLLTWLGLEEKGV